MTAIYHPLPISTTRSLKGLGTKHHGPAWISSVHCIRAALRAARQHAPEHVPLGDELAEALIDLADNLTVQDRAVLAVVLGDLTRMSRRDRNGGKQPMVNHH